MTEMTEMTEMTDEELVREYGESVYALARLAHVAPSSTLKDGTAESRHVLLTRLASLRKRAEDAERENAELRERLRWTPVEERLPEDTRDVWAHLETGAVVRAFFSSFGDGWTLYVPDVRLKVTHWMPLPDPPRGEGE